MAMQVVNKSSRGFSLLELLIALGLTSLTLIVMGTLFVSGHKAARHHAYQLMLANSINSALDMLVNDIRRAGFDDASGDSVKFAGASHSVLVAADGLSAAMIYRRHDVVSGSLYQYISYRFDNESLQVCETQTSLSHALLDVNAIGPCYHVVDENNIRIRHFKFQAQEYSALRAGMVITIEIDAELFEQPQIYYHLQRVVMLRNYQ